MSGTPPAPLDPCGEHVDLERVPQGIDEVTKEYGKHTVYLGSRFLVMQRGLHASGRGIPAMRQHQQLPIERKRHLFNLPFLADVH